jgi:predicted MFS family arabinose efflux permease
LRTVSTVLACGLLAGVALGALAPIELALQRDLHLSLQVVGWAASAITAVPAGLGLAAGVWIRRHGARHALVLGLLVMAAAGGAAAVAPNGALLLAVRAAQGAGYLLVVVAATIAITRTTDGTVRRAALALWTTVIPAGLAAAAAAGGVVSAVAGWRAWLALAAAAVLLVAGPALALPADRPEAGARRVVRPAVLVRPALLAAGFAAVAMVSVAVVVSFPTFLASRQGIGPAAAGVAAALLPLASIAGSLVAGWLLRRGAPVQAFLPAGLPLAGAAFPAFWSGLPASVNVAAGMALMLATGLLLAAATAEVPDTVADPGDVDLANGVLAQIASFGALLGPPAFATAVALGGWGAVGPAILPVTAAAICLLLLSAGRRPGGC